ncbi:MAG: M48 family metalloprotease [Rhodospirillales bacterium]
MNAFALPGGYIYITRGLLALADDASEVAGVVGHEIGHVTARHSAERYSKSVLAGVGASIIDIIARQGGVPGAGDAAAGAASLYLQAFSREQEMESDYLGARYMSRAQYHPRGLTGFFKKLKGYTKLSAAEMGRPEAADEFSAMSTHPRTDDRIAQAQKLERETKVKNPRYGRDALLDQIDGIIFRDDPAQGVRRGRLFQHPGLRFEFSVPPGFVMNNTPAAVIAIGPEGGKIVFDTAPASEARPYTDVQEFLTREWASGLRLEDVRKITVNGMEAATGGARTGSGEGARDVRLVAIRRSRDEIFRFIFATPPARTAALEEELRRTTYSFKNLSPEEAAAVRPMRIKVVTVRPGDTVESLAAEMPMERFKIEWFELLNAVQRGRPLIPGARVKTVVDG